MREFLVTSDIIKALGGNKWGRPCRPKISSVYFLEQIIPQVVHVT